MHDQDRQRARCLGAPSASRRSFRPPQATPGRTRSLRCPTVNATTAWPPLKTWRARPGLPNLDRFSTSTPHRPHRTDRVPRSTTEEGAHVHHPPHRHRRRAGAGGFRRAAAASARVLDLNANGSYVPAGGARTQALNPSPRGLALVLGQTPSASPAVHPKPDEPTRHTRDADARRDERVALVRRCPGRGPCISNLDNIRTQGLSQGGAAALVYRGGPPASTIGSPTDVSRASGHSPRRTPSSTGETFGWGDAGIGAAGMLLLITAGMAVAVTIRRQRHRVTAS